MKNFLGIFVMLVEMFLLSGCSSQKLVQGVPIRDNFEGSKLSNLWEADKIIPTDLKLQNAIFRNGHAALQITLHTNDKFAAGRNGSKDIERAELTEADWLFYRQGEKYAQTFSLFLPDDFPIVKTRLVLAQWKQDCPDGHTCDDDSPVLAIRYESGTLYITKKTSEHQTTLWRSTEEFRNRWLNFKFITRFDTSVVGCIVGYLNDSCIVDYTGPTAYKEGDPNGYPASGIFYFKMGLYRDVMSDPMTIYIDDYSKEFLEGKCPCNTKISTGK